ncbi:hypothetical protein PQR36_25005 [Paraburkholderia nemoris]|uniref:hypothetical protein n=1 Tax=Paraburkholderia nemoris TaxID=2793076 RepID=UPI0038B9BC73
MVSGDVHFWDGLRMGGDRRIQGVVMRIRDAVLFVSLSCVLGAQIANAQALLAPVENLVINRAEAAIISRVAIARGFAANDPRIASTLTAMGNVSTGLNVASTVVGAGLAFAGAPVWLTVAAGLGVIAAGTVIAGALGSNGSPVGSLAVVSDSTGKLQLKLNSNTSPSITSPGVSATMAQYGAFANGQPHLYADPGCMSSGLCAAFPVRPASVPMYFKMQNISASGGSDVIDSVYYSLDELANNVVLFNGLKSGQTRTYAYGQLAGVLTDSVSWITPPTWETAPNGSTRLHGQFTYQTTCNPPSSDFDCSSLVPMYVTNGPQTGNWYSNVDPYPSGLVIDPSFIPAPPGPPEKIYPAMPAALANSQLDAATLANLTNATWSQAASQPGYQGVPYSVTQPITAADVAPWAQTNPQSVPNIGDLFRPAADPGVSTVTISPTVQPGDASAPSPGSSPSATPGNDVNVVNTPNVNVVNKVSVDLGADPGVQSPTLEATPTISMILSPLLNLLPDLKSWAVPAHGASCPEPSFTVLGHSYTMTAQCDLAEANRTAVYSAFAAMFTLAALFIVLRA